MTSRTVLFGLAFAAHAAATLGTQVIGIRSLSASSSDLFFLAAAFPTYFGACLAAVAQKYSLASRDSAEESGLLLSSGIPSALATLISVAVLSVFYSPWLIWLGYEEAVVNGLGWRLLGLSTLTTAISLVAQAQRLRLALESQEFSGQVATALVSILGLLGVLPLCRSYGVMGFAFLNAFKALALVFCLEFVVIKISAPRTLKLAKFGSVDVLYGVQRLFLGVRWALVSKFDGIADRTIAALIGPGAVSMWNLVIQLHGQLMQGFDSLLAPSIYREASRRPFASQSFFSTSAIRWAAAVMAGWLVVTGFVGKIAPGGAFAVVGALTLVEQVLFSAAWGVVAACTLAGYAVQYRISRQKKVEASIVLTAVLFMVTVPLRWLGVNLLGIPGLALATAIYYASSYFFQFRLLQSQREAG